MRNEKGMFMIEELQRIALERCSTAREAIKLMGRLIEKYGYGDSGECLTIADPREVWIFEVLGEGIPSTADWIMLPIFGTIFTIGPFLLQLQALRVIPAFTVNLSYNLEPIYSIVFALIIFDEGNELNRYFWLGVLMIILSVVLQTIYSRRRD